MNSRHRIIVGLVALAVLGYWGFLFYTTHMPAPSLPDISNIDKVIHALAYCLLAIGLGGVVALNRPFSVFAAIAVWSIIVLYGCFDEYTQQFCEGRSCDRYDLLADSVGAFLGVACMFVVLRMRRVAILDKGSNITSAIEI